MILMNKDAERFFLFCNVRISLLNEMSSANTFTWQLHFLPSFSSTLHWAFIQKNICSFSTECSEKECVLCLFFFANIRLNVKRLQQKKLKHCIYYNQLNVNGEKKKKKIKQIISALLLRFQIYLIKIDAEWFKCSCFEISLYTFTQTNVPIHPNETEEEAFILFVHIDKWWWDFIEFGIKSEEVFEWIERK